MEKDFDKWNSEKKIIDRKTVGPDLYFSAREIWWCNAGLNIGVEADGKNENFERPMLIVKKFNSEMIWALPVSSKGKQNKYYFRLTSGSVRSWVMLSQIKTISTKRLLRKIESVSEVDFSRVLSKLIRFLKSESPLAGAISEAEATNS